jgi:hypothetical protein
MSLGDRIRAWLRGDASTPPAASRAGMSPPRASGRGRRRSPATADPAEGLEELVEFTRTRRGVEVYLEPRTNLYGQSVLLVADDGEYLRRPVQDAAAARAFCDAQGLPLYDARRVGYPRRVRDYDRGVRPDRVDLNDLPPWPGAQAPDPGDTVADDGPPEEDGPPPAPPLP